MNQRRIERTGTHPQPILFSAPEHTSTSERRRYLSVCGSNLLDMMYTPELYYWGHSNFARCLRGTQYTQSILLRL